MDYPQRSAADLEGALNSGLPAHRVERVASGDLFRADLVGYPQCSGFGASAEAALRAARLLFSHLRDGQAAATVSDMRDDVSLRLRRSMRLLVARALIGDDTNR